MQLVGLSNQNCITCLVERWAVLISPVGRQQFQPYEESRAGCSCWGRGCLFHLERISQLCSSRRQRAQGVIKIEACHRQGTQPWVCHWTYNYMCPPSSHATQFENPIVSPFSIHCRGHYRFLIEEKEKKTGAVSESPIKRTALKGLSHVQPQPASGNRNRKDWMNKQIIPYFLRFYAVFWHLQFQFPAQ